MKGLKLKAIGAVTLLMAMFGSINSCYVSAATGSKDSTVIIKKVDREKGQSNLNIENKIDGMDPSKLDDPKINDTNRPDIKIENNSQKDIKPITKSDSDTSSAETEGTRSEINTDESITKQENDTSSVSETDSKNKQNAVGNVNPEINNETKSVDKPATVKIVDGSSNSTDSVTLTNSDTPVTVFNKKTNKRVTNYKVIPNRCIKSDRARVVPVKGYVSTANQLPQTGAKNEVIVALSGLTIALVGIASAVGISRKKKNN